MDSIGDLFQMKKPNEPPQLKALRDYVKVNHDEVVKTSVSQLGYTMIVPSASLASTLRMEVPQIKTACNLDRKLFIMIG